jgi:hypothetical protein
LVRISNAKYKETGKASSYNDALNMLLESILRKYEKKPWQEFRDELLWNNEVDAVYKANENSLKLIYGKLYPKYGAKFRDTIDLMTRGSEVDITIN